MAAPVFLSVMGRPAEGHSCLSRASTSIYWRGQTRMSIPPQTRMSVPPEEALLLLPKSHIRRDKPRGPSVPSWTKCPCPDSIPVEVIPLDPDTPPPYLAPYLRAARSHGGGFRSLLWASPDTQAARFDAITRVRDLRGRSVLNVGCGRADLLDFLIARGLRPADYVGIEAVPDLAGAAERKAPATASAGVPSRVLRRLRPRARPAVRRRGRGRLQRVAQHGRGRRLLPHPPPRLRSRRRGAGLQLPLLRLTGRQRLPRLAPAGNVLAFARSLSPDVRVLEDYLDGDCTVAMARPADHS